MTFINSVLFAEANANTAQGSGSSQWGSLIFMVVLMVGVVLLMILPQRKRDKQVRDMLNSIKVGDRIRTIGGIYGTVVSAKEDLITIISGPDEVKLVFARGAVAAIEPQENTDSSEVSEDELEELESNENRD